MQILVYKTDLASQNNPYTPDHKFSWMYVIKSTARLLVLISCLIWISGSFKKGQWKHVRVHIYYP